MHYENILAQWCPLVREGHSHITQRAVGKNKAREEGRTFGNSLSRSRLSDPLSPSSAHYRSLSRPKRSGAESPLENCTAIMRYIYGMCALPLSLSLSLSLSRYMYPAAIPPWPHLRVEHIREEVKQRYAEGVDGSSSASSPVSGLNTIYIELRSKSHLTPQFKILSFRGQGEVVPFLLFLSPFPNAASGFFSDGRRRIPYCPRLSGPRRERGRDDPSVPRVTHH